MATIVDSACGCAALSLMPAGAAVLTVDFRVGLLAPAQGSWFIARGQVVKPGRTLTFCSGQVFAEADPGQSRLVATMAATMMTIQDRPNIGEG